MRDLSATLTDEELRDLGDLLASPGWALLVTMVDREWGAAGFGEKIARTIGQPNMDPQVAVQQLQQATVAQRAVQAIMEWPRKQVQDAKLRAQKAVVDVAAFNRGGV